MHDGHRQGDDGAWPTNWLNLERSPCQSPSGDPTADVHPNGLRARVKILQKAVAACLLKGGPKAFQ